MPAARRAIQIAGGRELPKLLFITCRPALAHNIGRSEAADVFRALSAHQLLLLDGLPEGFTAQVAAGRVRDYLQQHHDIEGVVVLGGYDVIPAQRLDVLDPELRAQMTPAMLNNDADNFIVWCDDVYGDQDGDGFPEYPVSRIPDGRTAQLLITALQSPGRPAGDPSRSGIRNVLRPFADGIFSSVPGDQTMLASEPTTHNLTPPYDLAAAHTYIMLHGSPDDGSRFWGEVAVPVGTTLEAMNVTNVPAQFSGVVFSGCCWGALIVERPAGRSAPDLPVAPRVSRSSVALKYLAAGANAFIGCTGSHYSPVDPPYGYYGGPLHAAFWEHYAAGKAPARALLDAKLDYLAGIPHPSLATPQDRAIELKTLRQFTSLGLGW